jgi:hypothetical protein
MITTVTERVLKATEWMYVAQQPRDVKRKQSPGTTTTIRVPQIAVHIFARAHQLLHKCTSVNRSAKLQLCFLC